MIGLVLGLLGALLGVLMGVAGGLFGILTGVAGAVMGVAIPFLPILLVIGAIWWLVKPPRKARSC